MFYHILLYGATWSSVRKDSAGGRVWNKITQATHTYLLRHLWVTGSGQSVVRLWISPQWSSWRLHGVQFDGTDLQFLQTALTLQSSLLVGPKVRPTALFSRTASPASLARFVSTVPSARNRPLSSRTPGKTHQGTSVSWRTCGSRSYVNVIWVCYLGYVRLFIKHTNFLNENLTKFQVILK